MPRRSLKVLRKPASRCNNSSSRYTRENHYAFPCSVYEFLRFSNYKISITLLIFSKCRGQSEGYPLAKLVKIFEIESILRGLFSNFTLKNTMEKTRKVFYTNIPLLSLQAQR